MMMQSISGLPCEATGETGLSAAGFWSLLSSGYTSSNTTLKRAPPLEKRAGWSVDRKSSVSHYWVTSANTVDSTGQKAYLL